MSTPSYRGRRSRSRSPTSSSSDENDNDNVNVIRDKQASDDENEIALAGQPSTNPITTVNQLLNYDSDKTDPNLVLIRAQTKPLSTNISTRVKMNIDGTFCDAATSPKLLVCHDFKGGYGHDKYVNGTLKPENYTFQHWLQTDIFVYFSHNFVTIPPVGWVNAAHAHGVKILGTIITEWNDGKCMCDQIFKNSEQVDSIVDKLCQINHDYMFDGYLVNIENEVDHCDVDLMIEFVQKLTQRLHQTSPKNLVIYYDSVITSGKLKWQNELNELNKPFFDVCDGIFLNYIWKPCNLEKSVEAAGERSLDVFVGIDVFGRGCYGCGGLYTKVALEEIEKPQKLSTAIFAPAWSFETQPYENYPIIDCELWGKCFPHSRFKCWTMDENVDSSLILADCDAGEGERAFRKTTILETDFSRGFGKQRFRQFQAPEQKPWFNLSCPSLQPLLYSWNGTLEPKLGPYETVSTRWAYYNTEEGFQGGGSLTCPDFYAHELTETLYKLCFPVDIPFAISGHKNECILVLCVWRISAVSTMCKEDVKPVLGFTFCNFVDPGRHDLDQSLRIIPTKEITRNVFTVPDADDRNSKSIAFALDDIMESSNDSYSTQEQPTRFHFSFNFDQNGDFNKRIQCGDGGLWNFSSHLLRIDELSKFGTGIQAVYLGDCEGLSIGYFKILCLQDVDH